MKTKIKTENKSDVTLYNYKMNLEIILLLSDKKNKNLMLITDLVGQHFPFGITGLQPSSSYWSGMVGHDSLHCSQLLSAIAHTIKNVILRNIFTLSPKVVFNKRYDGEFSTDFNS